MKEYSLFQTTTYKKISGGKSFRRGKKEIVYTEQKFLGFLKVGMAWHPVNDAELLVAFRRSLLRQGIFPIIYSIDKLPLPAKKKATILVEPREGLWDEIDKDQRTAIRRARKEEVSVKELHSKKDWQAYLKLLGELQERKGLSTLDKRFFWRCFEEQGFCRLLGAFRKKKLIAGCLFLTQGKHAFYKNSACRPECYKYQPVPLILWEFIEELREEGVTAFDLGGYDLYAKKGTPKYRINRFKNDWGLLVTFYEYAPRTYFLLRYLANIPRRWRKKA